MQVIGDTKRLPEATLDALNRACETTKHNSGLILNFALNYGGRAEITEAVKNSEFFLQKMDIQIFYVLLNFQNFWSYISIRNIQIATECFVFDRFCFLCVVCLF